MTERRPPALPDLPPGVSAVGWATVELDRAATELADLLADGTSFVETTSSAALGARCRAGRASMSHGDLQIVLLEPETEGRLAAFLARHGEGWAATWSAAAAAEHVDHDGGAERPGPLGPERFLPGRPTGGPYRLILSAATIEATMTDTAMTLRPAAGADAEAIATLFTDEGYPAGPSDIVERLTRFASDHSRVVVAEHEGALLGFIAIHALPRFEHDDRIIRVMALVVDAGARERGVGHALMEEAERIGSEVGAAFIEITAGQHRPEARRLYESLGYDAAVAAYLRKKL